MKKLCLLIALCSFISIAKSQNYGTKYYPYPSSHLSSGTRVLGLNPSVSTGFLMAGYLQASSFNDPNFYLSKTSTNGLFGPPPDFSRGITVLKGAPGCGSTLNHISNCLGVNAIESYISGNPNTYAIAGAYDQGCFFSSLDQNGLPISVTAYEFPSGAVGASKPVIIEGTGAPANSMYYYICGTYINGGITYTYLIKCDETGAIIWTRTYDLGSNTRLSAADMVLSPYGSEVILVGTASTAAAGHKGFFLKVKMSSGGVNLFKMYGQTGAVGVDEFGAITVAASTTSGGHGYVIGGYSDASPGSGFSWFVKLDPSGSILFNNIFYSPSDPNAGGIVDVIERYSSAYGIYTYFGACNSNSLGMMCMKLDDLGNAYGPSYINPLDAFNYFSCNTPYTNVSEVNSLSFNNTSGGPDEGIQLYGTLDKVTGNEFYFAEAYFNGDIGTAGLCFQHNGGAPDGTTSSGPSTAYAQGVNLNAVLSACNNIQFLPLDRDAYPYYLCDTSGLLFGSNNKTGSATGIAQNKASASSFALFPNPSSSAVTMSYNNSREGAVKLELYNTLGQQVKTLYDSKQAAGAQSLTIDLSTLNIPAGIYIVQGNISGSIIKEKIVYTGN